jgi:phospholipid-transporting ATPase
MATCHSIDIEVNDETDEINYLASSPDELALINFAKFSGMEYLGIDKNKIISLLDSSTNQTLKFELLNSFEFNSDRKRMSVIVKDL